MVNADLCEWIALKLRPERIPKEAIRQSEGRRLREEVPGSEEQHMQWS